MQNGCGCDDQVPTQEVRMDFFLGPTALLEFRQRWACRILGCTLFRAIVGARMSDDLILSAGNTRILGAVLKWPALS
jgi:hypothetical protein